MYSEAKETSSSREWSFGEETYERNNAQVIKAFPKLRLRTSFYYFTIHNSVANYNRPSSLESRESVGGGGEQTRDEFAEILDD